MMMETSTLRIQRHLEQLAEFTATPGQGTTRMSYSEQDKQARDYIKQQMRALGLQVREDAIGNIYGRLEGSEEGLPAVIIGSHFDSVPHGGAFDGPAGIVTGLDVVARIREQQLQPRYPLEVIALVEEEGTSFGRGLMASSVITGLIGTQTLYQLKDRQGVSAAQRMADAGFNADKAAEAVLAPSSVKAFLELHIEQGPVLEQANEDIGIVDIIVGIAQLEVKLSGKAGHAGTTPMDMRADALVNASRIISQIPDIATAAGDNTVATVGRLNVLPNGANVIPSEVTFSVDIRSRNESALRNTIEQIIALVKQESAKGNIQSDIVQPLYVSPTELAPEIHQLMVQHAQKQGLRYRTMVSGAGHDTMIFAGITRTGLIFVPSRNGLSHHPDEWTDYAQIALGADVMFATVRSLTEC
ncbi:Zn-dependent hydrolase [Providencia stuartii]|uniref:Amidase, hydantoinase/carbamoylase family n=3 Tax=Morganellaceae TaxID=1903414 RepID=A0AA86YKZ1_PROST|nr:MULTISPECIES: Zn-dependent hydrolase [Providencia]EDU59030.1 amidase, hydantoinase/carbamoylase family [Providencia stuartii ATCC 25827]MCL8327383.1 Zn-dependent hydrolase [Providencia thailandensis]MDF4174458.1 Zn-dependent hydrolase [Providencia thailandensis]MDN0011075.1 Zn-dependent hydrolase [Providencia stuartii]WAZ80239.1 Zn-dependent hydrolase [Providencia stuartii]